MPVKVGFLRKSQPPSTVRIRAILAKLKPDDLVTADELALTLGCRSRDLHNRLSSIRTDLTTWTTKAVVAGRLCRVYGRPEAIQQLGAS